MSKNIDESQLSAERERVKGLELERESMWVTSLNAEIKSIEAHLFTCQGMLLEDQKKLAEVEKALIKESDVRRQTEIVIARFNLKQALDALDRLGWLVSDIAEALRNERQPRN